MGAERKKAEVALPTEDTDYTVEVSIAMARKHDARKAEKPLMHAEAAGAMEPAKWIGDRAGFFGQDELD